MWVRPRTGYGTPGPKRIRRIYEGRLVFDALVSRRPGEEGTIKEQPAGNTAADRACWFPVVAPTRVQPNNDELKAEVHSLRIRLKEALRENERWSPRGDGEHELRCAKNEVRRLFEENCALKKTVTSKEAEIEAYKSAEEHLRAEAVKYHNKANNAVSDLNGAKRDMGKQIEELKKQIKKTEHVEHCTAESENLAWEEAERYRNELIDAADAIKTLKERARQSASDLEFNRALLKNTKKERDDMEARYAAAITASDYERRKKEELQKRLLDLQELFVTKEKESQLLLGLYETRVARDKKPPQNEIVM
jgi:chromosome segregation ATPase